MSATIERLREKLEATGKTQDEIAAGSGVSQTTVSRIMSGAKVAPRITTVEALEKFAKSAKPKRKRSGQNVAPEAAAL